MVSYALGDVANNLAFQMTSMFLMVYMTDIVGLSAAAAGTIYAVTKVWAGVADLVAGSTVDKANTKWGRLRPWILWGSTPLAITLVLLFSTPAGLTPTQAFVWVLLLDAAFQLAYSFVNIPYGSLSAAMTQNSLDRSRLSGARSIASAVTGVALSAVISPQFKGIADQPMEEVRRVEDGHPLRGRLVLDPVVRPQVRPGPRRRARRPDHRGVRLLGGHPGRRPRLRPHGHRPAHRDRLGAGRPGRHRRPDHLLLPADEAIDRKVAERLGVPYIGQRLSSTDIEAAETTGLELESGWDRFVRSLANRGVSDADLNLGSDQAADRHLAAQNTIEVLDAVGSGGVILGRNATVILAQHPGALHVRLNAPAHVRVGRAAELDGITAEVAEERREQEDLIRAELSQRLYGGNPNDDENYDVVVNTGRYSLDEAADMIIRAYETRFGTRR